MTPFSILMNLAGLSQREAAAFLKVSPSSVDKMARGVRNAPDGVIDDLRDLIDKQETAADEALALIDEQDADEIELGYPTDDHEAQSLGWPCVGAWKAMAARVIAGCDCVVLLVPRGSTLSTAASIDRHRQYSDVG